ncbi:leucine-rich repeats and immunoglobulin-like domains protein 3 [Asterias rubens]|uniref:leucine-rich repeats and immunoglobulin-like domains protein 3 n=1 Tax=Asterias rubens TaxID=7604 RepID=UPI001455496B|nr:leucine-rich repeats and immunoglobulin-like domains protein 3 [Asterias rubens]XP_033647371.1 leucine-rich repeats and immunoglobulin-like domains protein 3 [Asterias rubens]
MASAWVTTIRVIWWWCFFGAVGFLGRGTLTEAQQQPQYVRCPEVCSCLGEMVDCSKRQLTAVPNDIPHWVKILDLSKNQITEFPTQWPSISNLTRLLMDHNEIEYIEPGSMEGFVSLRKLDLSYNNIVNITENTFPSQSNLHHIFLNNNRITLLAPRSLEPLRILQTLNLEKNRIEELPKELFLMLDKLVTLNLSRNKLSNIKSLNFEGLANLDVLNLRRNRISTLEDGAFYGLATLQDLQLDGNRISNVSKGWLFGLDEIRQLLLSRNLINATDPEGWKFCQSLEGLDLSFNRIQVLKRNGFERLPGLLDLFINQNVVSNVADGAFKGLPALKVLELGNNRISWSLEDMPGAFEGLTSLKRLNLANNKIRSIAKKAFDGIEGIEDLDLRDNNITSIQVNAFHNMDHLSQLLINSSTLFCDCQLSWFPGWVDAAGYRGTIDGTCSHPPPLRGANLFSVEPTSFTCDDNSKPLIIRQPQTTEALQGDNVSLVCMASSSSESTMEFTWKKDGAVLNNPNTEVFASQGEGNIRQYKSVLTLPNIRNVDMGRFQCVITNKLGSTMSKTARITVHVFPSFILTPNESEVRVGGTAKLECSATGDPVPVIAWKKDGGDDFPAARERRFQVMDEESEMFYISSVKVTDMGIYSCTATNAAGVISANATLTVLQSPRFLKVPEDITVQSGEAAVIECKVTGSPRPRIAWTKDKEAFEVDDGHLLTDNNGLLIIKNVRMEDDGVYTCEVSNKVGVEKGSAVLSVLPKMKYSSTTTGIIIILIVCCIVGTSLVWVLIIYHTRKQRRHFTTAHAGDPALPPEIPSSAFNGSSDGTIHQETSSGISSAATDKFPPDNPSDCDSLDGGPMIHHSLKYRHRLHPPMYPGDSSDAMDIAIAGGDVEDDKGDSVLDTPQHIHYDKDLDTDPESCPDHNEYPGHEASENTFNRHPYPRHPEAGDHVDGMSPDFVDGTLSRLFHPSVPPGSTDQEGRCTADKFNRSTSLGRHSQGCVHCPKDQSAYNRHLHPHTIPRSHRTGTPQQTAPVNLHENPTPTTETSKVPHTHCRNNTPGKKSNGGVCHDTTSAPSTHLSPTHKTKSLSCHKAPSLKARRAQSRISPPSNV